jgi:glucose-6-phosphate dehydrogenase assembly protein OpcA
MAGAVADRLWKTSTPDAIEADLAALWRELARGDAPIARAVMSNLIVFRARARAADADVAAVAAGLPLDDVAARHPSRMIVLEHCDDASPNAPFAAGVGIVTFGPPQARYGVEQIVFRSACPDASLLSILRRFVRGDLPTTVWCTEDLSEQPPLPPLLEVGRQLLYDSRQWRDVRRGVAALAAIVDRQRLDVADLNWRRLSPLRRVLVDARGPLTSAAWQRVEATITHAAGEDAIAWLCAAWIRSETNGTTSTSVEQARRSAFRAEAEATRSAPAFAEGFGASTVARSASGGGSLSGERDAVLSVTIADLTATLTAKTVDVVGGAAPGLSVGVRVETEAEAIAAELRSLSSDAVLVAALKTLAVQ